MKACSKCNEIKELANFDKDKRHTDGLSSWCRKCKTIQSNVRSRSKRFKSYWPNLTSSQAEERYNQMLDSQQNCCAICNRHKSEFKKSLAVDHNHETGEVRKLLCGPCNKAIGLLQDNPIICRIAANYLESMR